MTYFIKEVSKAFQQQECRPRLSLSFFKSRAVIAFILLSSLMLLLGSLTVHITLSASLSSILRNRKRHMTACVLFLVLLPSSFLSLLCPSSLHPFHNLLLPVGKKIARPRCIKSLVCCILTSFPPIKTLYERKESWTQVINIHVLLLSHPLPKGVDSFFFFFLFFGSPHWAADSLLTKSCDSCYLFCMGVYVESRHHKPGHLSWLQNTLLFCLFFLITPFFFF